MNTSTKLSAMLKKLLLVFTLAFVFNLVWEFAHSTLYASYQGGEITSFILVRAAVWDAVIIVLLVILAYASKINRSVFVAICGLLVSIVIELLALKTGRWIYDVSMPIIPILNIGLTPALQLALTGYITQKLVL